MARQWLTIRDRCRGKFCRTSVNDRGVSRMIEVIVEIRVSPSNGRVPLAIS